MGESTIKFGDKLFLYGEFMAYTEEFGEYEYNSVMGYMTVGGYRVWATKTDEIGAAIPGFVVSYLSDPQFTFETPFNDMEMIDVTNKLSLSLPLPVGTKVWMPTIQ